MKKLIATNLIIILVVLSCTIPSVGADTVTWSTNQVLGANVPAYPFAGVYEFDNLSIGDNVLVTSRGISQLVIKVKGTLTLGNNAKIVVRNGYYSGAPITNVANLTQTSLSSYATYNGDGYSLYANLFGKGGNGGAGGTGGHGTVNYASEYCGDGGSGGGGGAGGFGGGSAGSGGAKGYGARYPGYTSGYEGFDGRAGYANGGDGGYGGANSYIGKGGGATAIGTNATLGEYRSGGCGGGGNGGDGSDGNQADPYFSPFSAGGGGGGGGGGYGGGILTIVADKIIYNSSAPPKFLVSGQRGGSGGIGSIKAGSGLNGANGQGGILIINSNDYTPSTAQYNLSSSLAINGGGGHGTITGNPGKVFIYVTPKPVELVDSVPTNNATNVSISATINVTFNTEIQKYDMFNTISLTNTSYGQTVDGIASVSGTNLTFTPTNELEYESNYKLTIPANALNNQANLPNSKIEIQFTTMPNKDNSVLWKKNFGGPDGDNYCSVTSVADGFIAVGYSYEDSFGSGDWSGISGKGKDDAIIVKYDTSGNFVWKKNFGGAGYDYYNRVVATNDGFIAVGSSDIDSFGNGDWNGVTGKGDVDAVIVKYDTGGNIVWKKNFGDTGFSGYTSVIATNNGYIAVGSSDFGKGESDAIIVKYSTSGNIVWEKKFGGSGFDCYSSVAATNDGFIAVSCSDVDSFGTGDWIGVTGKGEDDAVIVKYDNDGNVVWKKNFGGSGYDYYNQVVATNDGYIAVGNSDLGSFGNGDWSGISGKGGTDAIAVKYDTAGNVVWKKNFGGSEFDSYDSVAATNDGYIAVGSSDLGSFGNGDWIGILGKGGDDAIAVKYDKNGNVTWENNFGGAGYDDYYSVIAANDGYIAVGFSTFESFRNRDWSGVAGKGSDDATIVKFKTNSLPLQFVSSNPSEGTIDVDVSSVITVEFNDTLREGDSFSDIELVNTSIGNWVDGNINLSGTTLTFTPTNSLDYGEVYKLIIPANALKNTFGLGLDSKTEVKFVTKTFVGNEIMWKKNFGGSDEDCFNSVIEVGDGYVAVGNSYSESFGNGDWSGVTGKGNVDAMIVKYDLSGNVVWKENFGGSAIDYYYSVTAVPGGYVAVGYSSSLGTGDLSGMTGKGFYDAIIVKYDTYGNIVWKKSFGGSDLDQFNSVSATADGIIAVGYSSPESFGNGDWSDVTGKGDGDAIIVKYDTNGNVIWKKNFGGSQNEHYLSVFASNDGIVATGYACPGTFGTGDWEWSFEEGTGGYYDYDAFIVKYDINGNVVWKDKFGSLGSDYFNSVTAVTDGYIAVGYSTSKSFEYYDWTFVKGKGYSDAIIVKYDKNGKVVWKRNFGGSGSDDYNSVSASSDFVIAVGSSDYESFGNGDWGGVLGKGDSDAIIVKYDINGNVVWKKNFGGGSEYEGYNSVATRSSEIIAVGSSSEGSFGYGDWISVSGKGDPDAIIVNYSDVVINKNAENLTLGFSIPVKTEVGYTFMSYFNNKSDTAKAAKAVFALYDSNDILIGFTIQDIYIDAGKTLNNEVTIQTQQTAFKIKAFAMNGLNEIQPLTDSVQMYFTK